MIAGSRLTELPFKVWERAVLPVHLFDFEFSEALKGRSVLHDRHVVERDLCDRGMVYAHTDTCPPDSQSRDRHKLPLSEGEKKQVAKDCRWNRLAIDQLNFLPVLHQREFQLPGLFPTLNSMAEGNSRMGQVVLEGVVIGRGQQTSRKRDAGEFGQTEMVIDRQFDFTFDHRLNSRVDSRVVWWFRGRAVGASHRGLLAGHLTVADGRREKQSLTGADGPNSVSI